MYDLLAIGDATLDVFMHLNDASVMCELDNHNCKMCLNYGDKIAVDKVDFIIGGNAANAAVGSKRLGLSSAYLGTIGNDDTGKQIQSVFHKEGVSTEYLTVAEGEASNYSVVLNFQAERTILVHHNPRHYVWNVVHPPKWAYLTSAGAGFEPLYDKAIDMVRAGNVFLAYNPGTHQLKKGYEFLKPSLAITNILFLNREESSGLLNIQGEVSITELLTGLKNLGPQMVVITDGAKGSFVYDGKTIYQCGIFNGPVVERTGCGDAYATAFTVAICEGKSISEAMMWGSANSTSVLAYVGPQAGLLTVDGINQMIEKNKDVQPKTL
jgi:ribokinase